ncbi:hypothetical protein SprV_0902655100 [Sparganum proliferum]
MSRLFTPIQAAGDDHQAPGDVTERPTATSGNVQTQLLDVVQLRTEKRRRRLFWKRICERSAAVRRKDTSSQIEARSTEPSHVFKVQETEILAEGGCQGARLQYSLLKEKKKKKKKKKKGEEEEEEEEEEEGEEEGEEEESGDEKDKSNAHQLGHDTSGREVSACPAPTTSDSLLPLAPTSPSHSSHLTNLPVPKLAAAAPVVVSYPPDSPAGTHENPSTSARPITPPAQLGAASSTVKSPVAGRQNGETPKLNQTPTQQKVHLRITEIFEMASRMRQARDRQRESLALSDSNRGKSVANIFRHRSSSKRGHELPPLLNDNKVFLIDDTDKAELFSASFAKHLNTESEPVPFFRSLSDRTLSTIDVSSDLIKKHISRLKNSH